jgi:hypothetical protein
MHLPQKNVLTLRPSVEMLNKELPVEQAVADYNNNDNHSHLLQPPPPVEKLDAQRHLNPLLPARM